MAKKNFLDEELQTDAKLSYTDGFRFGFGMFIAWLLGTVLVGGLATLIAKLLNLR